MTLCVTSHGPPSCWQGRLWGRRIHNNLRDPMGHGQPGAYYPRSKAPDKQCADSASHGYETRGRGTVLIAQLFHHVEPRGEPELSKVATP